MAALHVVCLVCVVAFMKDIKPIEGAAVAHTSNWEALRAKFTVCSFVGSAKDGLMICYDPAVANES